MFGTVAVRWKLGAAIAWLLAANAAAQSITAISWNATNSTEESNNAVEILISQDGHMVPLADLEPLMPGATDTIPPPGLVGIVFMSNDSSLMQAQNHQIAFISCDASSYPGNIDAGDVFSAAESRNVTAIVLYTEQLDFCSLADNQGSTYEQVYSFKNSSASKYFLEQVSANVQRGSQDPLYATVLHSYQLDSGVVNKTAPNNTQSGNGPQSSNGAQGDHQQGNGLGPSPSTAVAMIILYSITGIITALFLVIIVTGAIRAHRHPERYGPRNVIGRPRQSRARGLARAMLDSLPIVKFGERDGEALQKTPDTELAEAVQTDRPVEVGSGVESADATMRPTQQPDAAAVTANGKGSEPDGHTVAGLRAPAHSADGIATAAPGTPVSAAPKIEYAQGCSICTEDFEIGQDQRVLPCDHRFHPECVDPWLLNVSGTCPLCRIDLRAHASNTVGEVDEDGNPINPHGIDADFLPPPLAPDGRRTRIRNSILLGIRGMLLPEHSSLEDRTAAATRARLDAAARTASEIPIVQDEGRQRRRISNLFGIRTRRIERNGLPREQQPQDEREETMQGEHDRNVA